MSQTPGWTGALAVLFLMASCPALPHVSSEPDSPQRTRPLIDSGLGTFVDGAVAIAMTRDHIAGVDVAIVSPDAVLLAKGYGKFGYEPAKEMTADTLTRVGSISKTVAWIALMQLVEQHRISLDDPINLHLPAALKVPNDGFEQPILVRHLMNHTAGFEETILGHMEIIDERREMPVAAYLARYRPRRVHPPGEIAVYSNYGAALAGMIVAHVSQMPWEQYAEERILRPLGMRSATFRENLSSEVVEARGLPRSMNAEDATRLSAGFHWQNGRLEQAPTEYITHFAPAGALVASANDMAAYLQAFLNPQRFEAAGVLEAKSVREMFTPSFSNAPGFGTIYHGLFQYPFPGGQVAIGHDGDTRYQHAVMLIVPSMNLGIFVGVNTDEGLRLIEELPYQIGVHLQGVSRQAESPAPKSSSGAPHVEGEYLSLRRAYFRSERAILNLRTVSVQRTATGDLLISGLGPDTTRYAREDGATYREVGGPSRIAFRRYAGHTLLLDPSGANPLERLGFFAGSTWLLIIVLLTHVVSIGGTIQAVRSLRADPTERWTATCGAVPCLWLVSLMLAWIAVMPWLGDLDAMLTKYPGVLFPLACWMFLLASIVTVAVSLFLIARRPPWPPTRWLSLAFMALIFLSCAVTFQRWGLLGFSGW